MRVSKGKEKIVSPRKPSAKKPCAKKPAAKKTGVNRNRRSWLKKGQSSGMGTSEVNRRQQASSEPNRQEQANSGPNDQQPNRGPTVRFYVSAVPEDDDDDPIYDYHSEDLHTPNSTDDESSKHTFPEFDDHYAFGEGRFELGTRFATIERFKEVVKDSFISEGRELRWIKNDRERVRVGCMNDDCPW